MYNEYAFTINALAKRMDRDRHSLERALFHVKPDAMRSGRRLFMVSTAERALAAKKPSQPLHDAKVSEEIRRLRISNDKLESRYVNRVAISGQLQTVLAKMRTIIERRLVDELSLAVVGLEPAGVRVKARELYDVAMAECAELDAELTA